MRHSVAHINDKLFVSELQYTTTLGEQKREMNQYEIKIASGENPFQNADFENDDANDKLQLLNRFLELVSTFSGRFWLFVSFDGSCYRRHEPRMWHFLVTFLWLLR